MQAAIVTQVRDPCPDKIKQGFVISYTNYLPDSTLRINCTKKSLEKSSEKMEKSVGANSVGQSQEDLLKPDPPISVSDVSYNGQACNSFDGISTAFSLLACILSSMSSFRFVV